MGYPNLMICTDSADINNMTAEIGKLLAKSRSIYIIVGAGISVGAGIPDFRSENGLYNEIKAKYPGKVHHGIDLFDGSYLYANKHDPIIRQMYFSFLGILKQKSILAKSTLTHKFIAQMAMESRLSRLYTQNIDGLEKIEFNKVLEGNTPLPIPIRKAEPLVLPTDDIIPMPIYDTSDTIKIDKKTKSVNSNPYPNFKKDTNPPQVSTIYGNNSKQNQRLSKRTRSLSRIETSTPPNSSPLQRFLQVGQQLSFPSQVSPHIMNKILYLHGTLDILICTNCNYKTEMETYLNLYIIGTGQTCPNCEERNSNRIAMGKRPIKVGILTPEILLYNDRYNDGFTCGTRLDSQLTANNDIISSDLHELRYNRQYTKPIVLVIGTSCKVYGIKKLLKSFRTNLNKNNDRENWTAGPDIIYINKTELKQKYWKSIFDIQLIGDCDEIFQQLYYEMKK